MAAVRPSTKDPALRPFLRWLLLLSWGVPGLVLLAQSHGIGHPWLVQAALLLAAAAPSIAALFSGHAAKVLAAARRPPKLRGAWPLGLFAGSAICLGFLFPGEPVARSSLALLGLVAPFGEEFGWKTVLLPWLLARYSAVKAGLVAGGVWIVWHLPALLVPGTMRAAGLDLLWWALGTLALSLFMTLIFRRSRGDVWTSGVAPHLTVDALGLVGWWSYTPLQVGLVVAAALGLWLQDRRERGGAC